MYERMLNKSIIPSDLEIEDYLGPVSVKLLQLFEKEIEKRYEWNRELVFPFGNNYGWGFKYAYKTKHLCHLFFEKDAFTILLQISEKDKEKLESVLIHCQPKAKELWEKRYPCGEGGWVYYRVMNQDDIMDVVRFLEVKKKPSKVDLSK